MMVGFELVSVEVLAFQRFLLDCHHRTEWSDARVVLDTPYYSDSALHFQTLTMVRLFPRSIGSPIFTQQML